MKTISSNLAGHLASELTTLCACWLVTRTDGTIFGFTDHDIDIVFNGVTYSAESGFLRTAISNTATAAPGELEVQGFLDSGVLTEHDLRAGLYNYALVELFLLNWASLSDGQLNLRYGNFGEVTITSDGAFKVELRGLMQKLEQQFLETYGPNCRADLGDARCKIQLNAPLRQSSLAYAVGDRVALPLGPIENVAVPNGNFGASFATSITGWTLVNMAVPTNFIETTDWLASATQSVTLAGFFGVSTDNAAVVFSIQNVDLYPKSTNQQARLTLTYLDSMNNVLGMDATAYGPTSGLTTITLNGTVLPGTATVVFALQTNELVGPAAFSTSDVSNFSNPFGSITPVGGAPTAVLQNTTFSTVATDNIPMDWTPLTYPALQNTLRSVNTWFGLVAPDPGGFFGVMASLISQPGLNAYESEFISIINGDVTDAEIDTGTYGLVLGWQAACVTPTDAVGVGVIFYDGSGNVVLAPTLVLNPLPVGAWKEQSLTLPIPVGARQIRVIAGWGTTSGSTFAVSFAAITDIIATVQSQTSLTPFDPTTYNGVEYVVTVAGTSADATPKSAGQPPLAI